MCDCNKKPGFSSEIDNALLRRVVDIPFPNTFTDDESKINNVNIFKANLIL